MMIPPELFLPGIILAIHDLLCFQMNSRVVFSSTLKNAIGALIAISLNLQITVRNLTIFIILTVLMNRHKRYFHLVSSSIFSEFYFFSFQLKQNCIIFPLPSPSSSTSQEPSLQPPSFLLTLKLIASFPFILLFICMCVCIHRYINTISQSICVACLHMTSELSIWSCLQFFAQEQNPMKLIFSLPQ